MAIDACLKYIYTVSVHFGSNPKEESLGLFYISDSGQGLRRIEHHVFNKCTEVLRCNC